MIIMWQRQFNLYNSIDVVRSKQEFFSKVSNDVGSMNRFVAVLGCDTGSKYQKKGKSAVPNGIHMESFMFADIKLQVHLSFLFPFCLNHCYLPKACMESVLFPMIKNKKIRIR